MKKMELRFEDMNLSTNDEGKLVVSGYVNKTNQWSQTLGVRKKFVERILPGAFKKALQNGNEINFLAEHNNEKILFTTRNDSLQLREDDKGLYMTATISPTSWGKDYYTLIKDGVIKNMSFGMKVMNDNWDRLSDGTFQRSISDLALFEVSAVRNPAYAQSSIAARSIEIVEDVEPLEKKHEEKRDLSLRDKLSIKKYQLNGYEKLAKLGEPNADDEQKIKSLKGEIRQMESQLKIVTADN
jgi:HK97 family phage prohead protease